MLTDKAMTRLAEDCGWMALTIHNPPLGPATDYRDNNGNLMIDATGQLTDAGCWQASERLLMDFAVTDIAHWLVVAPKGRGGGEGLHPDRRTALMLAIQEVYA